MSLQDMDLQLALSYYGLHCEGKGVGHIQTQDLVHIISGNGHLIAAGKLYPDIADISRYLRILQS